MAKERQQSWSEYLDEEKENKLFVRFVFTPDFREVEEFAVVYITIQDERHLEVVRYDCSGDEAVNVHQFFYKPAKKRYLDREKNFDTLQGFVEDARKNWRLYRARFFER